MTGRVRQTASGSTLGACVAELESALGGVFAALRSMAEPLECAWRAGSGPFTPGDVAGFQREIFEQLDAQSTFDSAGFVMSEFALDGVRRHLEWWHRGSDRTFQPLILNVEPGTPECYDYYAMAWFFAGLSQQRRFIAGPMIDLPCADVCIMTFTEPMLVDGPDGGEVLGVAAADVALSRFEALILPPLRRIAAPAVLVNADRRVITSNDAAWITGEKLSAVPEVGPEWQAVAPVTPSAADLNWRLAVAR